MHNKSKDIGRCISLLIGCGTSAVNESIKSFAQSTFSIDTEYTVLEGRRNVPSVVTYSLGDKPNWTVGGTIKVNGLYDDGHRIYGEFQYMYLPRTERREPRRKSMHVTESVKRFRKYPRFSGQSVGFIPNTYRDQEKDKVVTYKDEERGLDILVSYVDENNVPETGSWWDTDTMDIRKRFPELEILLGAKIKRDKLYLDKPSFCPDILRGMDILAQNVLTDLNFKVADRERLVQDSGTYKRSKFYKLIGGLRSADGIIIYYRTKSQHETDALLYYPSRERKPRVDRPHRIKVTGSGKIKGVTHTLRDDGLIVDVKNPESILELKQLNA